MELRELRAFVVVAEVGALSGAARILQMSQPRLTQMIQALERQFGVDLLVRSNSGVSLTPAGSTLLTEARAMLARHEQLVSAMDDHLPDRSSTLRVGVPLELPPEVLGDAVAAVTAKYPATDVQIRHISTAAQIAALKARELECALVRERPNDSRFDVLLVVEEPLGVLVSAEDLPALQRPGGVRLEDLASLRWVGFPRDGSPAWYDELTSIMRSHGHDTDTPHDHTENLIPEIKLAVVSGGGRFAFAPPAWPSRLPEAVRWAPLIGDPLRRRTWAVWHASSNRRDLAHLIASLRQVDAGGL